MPIADLSVPPPASDPVSRLLRSKADDEFGRARLERPRRKGELAEVLPTEFASTNGARRST
ncbi:hypothetical protein B9J07_26030 [Sinorhizobium sp. LM21]|nr:hypothetical protein B9J07_26030 [Sinorhizobium sp. LM21]